MSATPIVRAGSIRSSSLSSKDYVDLQSGSACCLSCGESEYVIGGQPRPKFCSSCGSSDLTFLDDVVPSNLLNLQEDVRTDKTVPLLLPEKWRPGNKTTRNGPEYPVFVLSARTPESFRELQN